MKASLILLALTPFAQASIHGPLVQWVQKPSERAHLIWLERVDDSEKNEGASFTVELAAKDGTAAASIATTVSQLPGTSHRIIHAHLESLQPDQLVSFRLMPAKGESTETFSFKTAPLAPTSARFVTGGDLYQDLGRMNEMNRQAGLADPLFALIGGDLAYTDDQKPMKWFDYFDSWAQNARTPDGRLVPKIVAIGNHEVSDGGFNPTNAHGPERAREFYSLFDFPEEKCATYTIDFGDSLSFVILDSGHTRNIAAQVDFLKTALEAREKFPHLFVCYHRPAYGVGAKPDCVEIQKDWSPLFEKHRVSAVFENDHHQFTRSHPITAGKVDKENGIPYLGAGAWSVSTRKVNEKQLKNRPWIAEAKAINHIYVIETKLGGFSANAIDLKGESIDLYERQWKR